MRENIFDLISNKGANLQEEYLRLYTLFESQAVYSYITLKKIIQKECFLSWKHRKRFLSIDDMMIYLGLDYENMIKNVTINKLLSYMEMILNFISLLNDFPNVVLEYSIDKVGHTLKENIDDLLEDLNYKYIYLEDSKKVIIIEKNNLTTAVAEMKPDLTNTVIEYRRFALKGDIEAKRQILKTLADKVEPLRENFKGTTYNNFVEDTFIFLNKLNIRHNNVEGNKAQQTVVQMNKTDLEEWYDRIYDMILGIFVFEKYLKDKSKIDNLKGKLK